MGKEVIGNLSSTAPPLYYNEFDPPKSLPASERVGILASSLDMQAMHSAIVSSQVFKSSRVGRLGFLYTERPKNISEKDLSDIQNLLRYCTGSHSLGVKITYLRIDTHLFNILCAYLKVNPLSLMSNPTIEVWDSKTHARYRLPLTRLRRRSSYA